MFGKERSVEKRKKTRRGKVKALWVEGVKSVERGWQGKVERRSISL